MNELIRRSREWKKFRKKHFLTQERLAAILGVTERTVQNIEYGRPAMARTLSKFAVLKGRYESNGGKNDSAPVEWRRDQDSSPGHGGAGANQELG